jgi:hypothetical protein
MTQPIDELVASAELGEESRLFLESDLGKCILGLANQQVMAAQLDLEIVSPLETEKIRQLQNQARLGRQFEQWLRELLHDGENAMQIFKSTKDEQ